MSGLGLEDLVRVREVLDTRSVCERYGCDERTARRVMRSTGCAFTLGGRLRLHAEALLEYERELAREQNALPATVDIAPSSRRAPRATSGDDLEAGWWRP